jgi:two-component system response regulator PilR (NtrC family)
VPLLAHHFLEKFAAELGKEVRSVSDEVMQKLLEYDYPGNVRELENVMERAVALSRGHDVGLDALPPTLLRPVESQQATRISPEGVNLEELVNEYERALLGEALRMSGGVKKRAAQLLGVSFRSFRYRLEKLGLDEADGSGA